MALATTSHVRDDVEFIMKTKEDRRMLMIIALWFTWNERNLIRVCVCVWGGGDDREQDSSVIGEMEQTTNGFSKT